MLFKTVFSDIKHLDWLKIGLNAAEIITIQDYKLKKKNWYIHNVKAKSQAGNIWVQDIITK